MSRSQKPRKKYRPGRIALGITNTPRIDEVVRIFHPIRETFAQLRRGEIEAIKGYPVFSDWQGEWSRIDQALLGWVSCWQRLAPALDQSALRKLHLSLEHGIPLTIAQIDAAERVLDQQQAIFLRTPVEKIMSITKTELLAIEFEAAGLLKEAA